MQGTHLTLVLFCHLLLASVVFYFTPIPVDGSPLFKEPQEPKVNSPPAVVQSQKPTAAKQAVAEPVAAAASQPSLYVQQADKPAAAKEADSHQEAKSSPVVVASAPAVVAQIKPADQLAKEHQQQSSEPAHAAKAAPISEEKTVVTKDERQLPGVTERKAPEASATKTVPSSAGTKQGFSAKSAAESILTKKDSDTVQPSTSEQKRPRKEVETVLAPTSPLDTQQAARPQPEVKQDKVAPVAPVVPQPSALVAGPAPAEATKVEAAKSAQSSVTMEQSKQQQQQAAQPSVVTKSSEPAKPAPAAEAQSVSSLSARSSPVVMGGLGPLHLLATTLCSYQPDKSVADENLNQLYARRASVRKSLFDFMSLKFTNLEKLSSRLGYGLQVVPAVAKSSAEDSKSMSPSHGWPVVGKCTAYDLKLMGEAAWCECQASDNCNEFESGTAKQQQSATAASVEDSSKQASVDADDKPAPITSNQHATSLANNRMMSARSMSGTPDASYSLLPSPEESSVISKILHVSDIKNAPLVESSIYNLNLTQHQLATLEAHATSTQECRRNALRYSKALFNHLAEDQRGVSESWPKLYAAISADDCARKRMIDIVNALSGFRTDTTSIRRDNLEFAFAMDDLRAKVLENEVNVPLTFDRHFIEVEQFLQQSVRLMLANIQPKRAKLTSMRYRSLMYGSSSDEQCVDLHQRLLARNYPSDCNPTQFGQLPDVLRMTASSLELWSIEKELSMRMAKVVDYPNESPAGQQKVKEDVNECIANLVSS